MDDTGQQPLRPKSRRFWAVFVVGATLIVIPLGVWLARMPIGEAAVRQYCSEKGVRCTLSIRTLGLNHIQVENIRLEKPNVDPVSIKALTIKLVWPELLSPVLTSVTARQPELVVDARNGQVSVDILESFQSAPADNSGSSSLPPFSIVDGDITIFTDAGPVSGVINTSGTIGREIQSSLVLAPAELSLNGHELSLQEGKAEFVLARSRISGDARLRLASARLQDMHAENIALTIKIEPGDDKQYVLDWDVSADHAERKTLRVNDLTSKGVAKLLVEDTPALETSRLHSGTAVLKAGRVSLDDDSIENVDFTLDLDTSGTGLTGPVSLKVGLVQSAAIGSAKSLLLTGDLSLTETRLTLPSGQLEGAVTVQDASVAELLTDPLLSGLTLPEPLDLHAETLRQRVDHLFKQFSTGTELDAAFSASDKTFSVFAHRPFVMRSADRGVVLTIRPDQEPSWFRYDGSRIEISGDVELIDNKTALSVISDDMQFTVSPAAGVMTVRAEELSLADWNVEERTLGVHLKEFRLATGDGAGRLAAKMQARYSGQAFGTGLKQVTLAGSFNGLEGNDGWILRLADDECFDFGFSSAELADITFGSLSTAFCAPGGLLFSRNDGAKGKPGEVFGELISDDIRLPVSHPAAKGNVRIAEPSIRWSMSDEIDLALLADGLFSTFRFPEDEVDTSHSLAIGKTIAAMNVAGVTTSVDLDLKDMDLILAEVPVGVTISEWTAQGELTDTGPELDWSLLGLQLTDRVNPADNALFEPMISSGTGRLTPERITYSGRLRLAKKDADFGVLSLTHDLTTNSGSAELKDGTINFRRGSLQPYDISERLRGIAVNSSGQVRSDFKASWTDGQPAASGLITLDNISFSTFALGQFSGLSGAIEFSDLLTVRTPPQQEFTLRKLQVSPTFELENGTISIQLVNANLLHIEDVSWPFAGGSLSIDPGWWSFDKTNQSLTVRANAWSLSQLATQFEVPDLDVRGTVSGSFPIEIVGPDIYLRNARLDAIEDGRIRYLGAVGAEAGASNEYAKMAFDALRNFDYRVLSIGANGNLLDEVLLEMSLSGRNPDVLEGHTFNLNISLQSKLAELIRGSSFATSATATKDAVLELLKQQQTDSDD